MKSRRFSSRAGPALFTALLVAGCVAQPPLDTGTSSENLARLQIQIGLGYMKEGNYEIAMKRFTRALEVQPDSAEGHNAMAMLYQRLKQDDSAEQHFRKAVSRSADYSRGHTNYGSFLCRKGRLEEAETQFLAAVRNPLYNRRETAFYNAGLCMLSHQRLTDAEAYFRSSLEVDQSYPPALIHMAQLCYDTRRYLPARAYLQRYQEVGTHTSRSLWLGYRVEQELGDRNAASSYAMLLKGNYPQSRETAQLLGSPPER